MDESRVILHGGALVLVSPVLGFLSPGYNPLGDKINEDKGV